VTEPSVTDDVLRYTKQVLPEYSQIVRQNVKSISANRQSTGAVGLLALVWIGTAVFDALAYTMNRVWDVPTPRHIILSKLLSVAGVIAVSLLLISTTLFSTAFETFQTFWWQLLKVPPPLEAFRLGAFLAASSIIFVALVIIYAVVPNIRLGFKDVWLGAASATVVLELAKWILVFYTSKVARFNAIYGSVGVTIGLLFWLYVMGMIVILGAEVNAALKGKRKD
jgi:membrane protein